MNILMVLLTNEYPPDPRVEGEIEALRGAGHSVYMLTVKDGLYHPHPHRPITFKLPRILYPKKSYPVLCLSLLFTILYLKHKWKINWVHVHDIIHAVPTVVICKILMLKVTTDVHEDFVDALRFRSKYIQNSIVKFCYLSLASLFSLLERFILFSDHIITVSPLETKRWVEIGANPSYVTDIPNVMTLPKIMSLELETSAPINPMITYVGGFAFHRGLGTLVEAMKQLERHINVKLKLVGDGHMMPHLKEQSKNMKNIHFTGSVPFTESIKHIADCTIFVIPYHRSRQTDKSSPHKLYQAMYLKKPLIVSDCPMLKRVVKDARCGLSFRSGSHEHLAKKIIYLLKRPDIRKRLGESGHDYTVKNSWAKESQKLLSIYEEASP